MSFCYVYSFLTAPILSFTRTFRRYLFLCLIDLAGDFPDIFFFILNTYKSYYLTNQLNDFFLFYTPLCIFMVYPNIAKECYRTLTWM